MQPQLEENAMIICSCLVQAGQSPDLHRTEIQGLVREFTDRSFGEDAQITWTAVAQGDGYTAGEPSTSSVISIVANEPLSPPRREALLREFVALWTEATGSSVDEIVAVIADPTNS